MKIRKPKRQKSKPQRRTPEEQALDSIFIDETKEEGAQKAPSFVSKSMAEQKIDLSPPEDKSNEAFEFVDYGLNTPETMVLWEATASNIAKEFHPLITNVLATFDAIKSVEGHLTDALQTTVNVLTDDIVRDAEEMIRIKIKSMILEKLQFPTDQHLHVFEHSILKRVEKKVGGNPIEALAKYLKVEVNDDPYAVKNNPVSYTKSMNKE